MANPYLPTLSELSENWWYLSTHQKHVVSVCLAKEVGTGLYIKNTKQSPIIKNLVSRSKILSQYMLFEVFKDKKDMPDPNKVGWALFVKIIKPIFINHSNLVWDLIKRGYVPAKQGKEILENLKQNPDYASFYE